VPRARVSGGRWRCLVADDAPAAGTSLSSDTLARIDEALSEAVERDGSLVGSMLPKKRPT
jgi:hypothetical protein